MRQILVLILAFACSAAAFERPVHTYSIVARDAETGEMGVAVQSHWFSVGQLVTWGQAGVGVVATQSFVDPAYGPRLLALLESGLDAPTALAAMTGADAGEAVRQVAVVDAQGRVAAHTGAKCIESAGHHTGDGYSVQANMMLSDAIVPAMVEAFEASTGPLAERLVAALEAAQNAGGDIRGKQSAAILVVAAESSGKAWEDRILELRIEDHPEPITELVRLLQMQRAYEHMNAGDLAVEEGDLEAALVHYGAAAEMNPDSLEMRYWTAISLATGGEIDQAKAILSEVFAADPNWIELTRRLTKPGIISDDPEGHAIVEALLSAQ